MDISLVELGKFSVNFVLPCALNCSSRVAYGDTGSGLNKYSTPKPRVNRLEDVSSYIAVVGLMTTLFLLPLNDVYSIDPVSLKGNC
jgi:hypothetical protein